ncbi:MAG: hypothetical protein HC871_17320 [Rhizobiales bacterium]|nr:hypothetical protein [Hyphomicrobiales bacterium]
MIRYPARIALLVLCAAALAKPALADIAAMGRLTKAMVLEAAGYYRSVSFDEAVTAFSDLESERWLRQPFHLHMFGMRADGMVWADNIFHELVGVDFSQVFDLEGVQFGKQILERTAETTEPVTIQIRFLSPATGNETISVGSCMRPEPENVLCSWSELE